MSRKPYNFRRGGGSGSKSQRRFGGTGSLGNYKRSGNRNDGHAENRRSGSWGGDNFNRSYNGSNNHSNNNNSFGSISNSKLNNQEDSFQKFRDPNALEQYNGNSRYHHNSQGRDRGQDRHGGKAHFGNETYKNDLNWYEDQRNAHLSQAEEQNQNYSSSSAMQVSSTSSMPQTISSVTPSTITSTTPKNPPHDEECNLESKKHILKNIKQEKTEVEEVNRISKQTHKPASSSSSSSESSESEDEALTSNQPKNIAKSNTIKVKQEALGKQIQKKNTEQSTSSDSSSSSSSSEEDNKISDKVSTKPNIIMEKGSKTAKKQSKKKQASEEDLICLGKLERNFVIEDDVSEDTEISSHNKSGTFKNQCLICDKQGHTAFECQMICKNCSAPYHNMKSCPKPVNLSTMLQSYMEFCIGQMSQFNPEKKFMMPPNICISENSLTKSNEQSTVQNKRVKRLRTKSEDSLKRPTKRKHRYASKSSDDEEDEKNDGENKTRTETSESESESVSSEELISTKVKKRRTKMSSPMKTPKFHNTFVPQFSSFPAFGAAAATYNPLLLGQLMNSGGFGAADKLIFQ